MNQIFSAPYFLRPAGFLKILDQQFQLIRVARSKITPIFAVDVFNRSHIPEEVKLRVGTTASVLVMTGTTGKKSEKRAVAAPRALQ
jgi:hypothetical protein